MEDDAAARGRRVPDCRQGGGCDPAGCDPDRAHPHLAVSLADAVHWLGLFPRRRAASDRGLISVSSPAKAGDPVATKLRTTVHQISVSVFTGCPLSRA